MPSVYLAGFDVFYPDALARGEYLKALCATHGLEGLYPLDAALPEGLSDPAGWICQANLDSLRRADAVLANLGHFRGNEPDSGTVFEVGFACALGKPVWAYFPDQHPLQPLAHNSFAGPVARPPVERIAQPPHGVPLVEPLLQQVGERQHIDLHLHLRAHRSSTSERSAQL